jgi:FkbM family methyltransferase
VAKITQKLSERYGQFRSHPFVGLPVLGIARYIWINFLLRLFPKGVIINWFNGLKFRLKKGDSYFIGNYYFGLNDPWESFFLMSLLREEDLFCDIGAHQGHYSMLVGKFAACDVHAFEPSKEARERLEENLELSVELDPIEIYPYAVGMSDEKISLTQDLGSMNRIIEGENHKKRSDVGVDMIRLDSFYASGRIPMAIKLDIEGYELPALKGAEKLLSSDHCRCLLVELNNSGEHYGIEDSEVVDFLRSKGFETFVFDLDKWTLKAIPGKWPGGYNTLFVKDADFVNQRLREKRIHFLNRRNLRVEITV